MYNKNTKKSGKATTSKKKASRTGMHAYTICLPDDAVAHVRKATHVDAVASAVCAFIRIHMSNAGEGA
jgi:hypothetical protein